jgi:hypothetical protein
MSYDLNKNWRGSQDSLNYDGDISKVRFSVFRELTPNTVYPLFVRSKELKLDDIIFVESKGFTGYCLLSDYKLERDGNISNFFFKDSGIDLKKQYQMIDVVKGLLYNLAKTSTDKKEVIMLTVSQRNEDNG